MPYVRKSFSKKRKNFRKGNKRTSRGFSNKVRSVIRGFAERKEITQDYSTPAEVDWTGRLHACHEIKQGDSTQERTGTEIQAHSVAWNITARNDGSPGAQSITVMLVRDMQQVKSTHPAISDILNPSTVGTLAAPNSLLNIHSRGRFKVLYRRQYTLADQTGADSSSFHIIKGYKRLSFPLRYNGSGSTNIDKNGLYMLFISDGDPAADSVYIVGSIRFYFTDV